MYPQFESWVAAKYDRPGGPFDPHSGTRYAYSQIADQSFKRLTHTVNVPAGGANMSFWTSYNTEADWDQLFVEAHTVGQDDWTTLEDTERPANDAGDRRELQAGERPRRVAHDPPVHGSLPDDRRRTTACLTARSGDWWAISGNSGGWQQWHVDLTGPGGRFAGKQIEVSITYVSDWASRAWASSSTTSSSRPEQGTTDFESE